MSRFYVGQRVRLVRPLHPENAGRTGRIVSFQFAEKGTPTSRWPLLRSADCVVDWDGLGTAWANKDTLEPILYDGNQLVSWQSMKDLWTPAGGVMA